MPILDLNELKTAERIVSKILKEVRQVIQRSKHSRYAISKETSISEAQLSRLMAGTTGLSINSLEQLLEFLGLELVIRPKKK